MHLSKRYNSPIPGVIKKQYEEVSMHKEEYTD